MQKASSRIWFRVTVFLFYIDNHYTMITCMRAHTDRQTHTHTYIYEIKNQIYIYIYIYIYISSSSCLAISTGIPDPLSPGLPIIHCFRLTLRATSRIGTELLYVDSSWSSCFCSSMGRRLQGYITSELVPTSPAVPRVSGSSNFDSFRYGW